MDKCVSAHRTPTGQPYTDCSAYDWLQQERRRKLKIMVGDGKVADHIGIFNQ